MTLENDLIKHPRQFEEKALAEIYDRYSPGVYRYAMRLLGENRFLLFADMPRQQV